MEKLAREVLTAAGQPSIAGDWNPDTEAAQYLDEAAWAWRQADMMSCREAIDAARALGEHSPDYVFLHTWMLCFEAAPREDAGNGDIQRGPLKERYEAALASIDGCSEYLDGHLDNHLKRFTTDYTGDARQAHLRQKVVSAASRTLMELYDHPDPIAMPDAPLREAIRKLQGFGATPDKLPTDVYMMDGTLKYAPLWANDADELAAYYCTQINSSDPFQVGVANFLVQSLYTGRERLFSRFPKPEQAFNAFLDNLAASERGRLAAYMIRSGGGAPVDERKAWFAKFLDEFWARRGEMIHPKTVRGYAIALGFLERRFYHLYCAGKRLRLLRYYLANSSEAVDTLMGGLWNPAIFPPGQAADIWKEYNAFKQRCLADREQIYRLDWAGCEKSFRAQFPALAADAPQSAPRQDVLAVTHFWTPYAVAGVPQKNIIYYEGLWTEGKLWLLCASPGAAGGTSRLFPSISKLLPRNIMSRRPARGLFWCWYLPMQYT